MERLTAALILFAILLLVVFLVDYLFIKRKYYKNITGKKKGKKKNKDNELLELSYLVVKFNLDKTKLPLNSLLVIISLFNAFIISLVAVVVIIININIILQLIIGFILLLALIYSMYELLGRYLVKKGFGK